MARPERVPSSRRELLAAGLVLACAPVGALAQQGIRRIGVLMVNEPDDPEQQLRLARFRERLSALGWVEGRNLSIEVLWSSGNAARAVANAREMVASRPDVIVSSGTSLTLAVQRETRTIPVVFVFVSDPVRAGLVNSLAKPGGNITGVINIEASVVEKWPELLKEIAPRIERIAIMFNPDTAAYIGTYHGRLEATAARLGASTIETPVRSPAQIEEVVAGLGRDRASGLVAMADSFLAVHRKTLIAAAASHKVPAIYFSGVHVAEGGLISYGIEAVDHFVGAAPYADRILRGAHPSELPVEQPSKFVLTINAKAARALGLAIPPALLLRADRVVE